MTSPHVGCVPCLQPWSSNSHSWAPSCAWTWLSSSPGFACEHWCCEETPSFPWGLSSAFPKPVLWDLARPPEVLGSLAGALQRHTWPGPGPASLEGLFLLLPGLVAAAGAGWAACWSVLGGDWLLSVTAPYSSWRRNSSGFSCLWEKNRGAHRY